MQKQSNKEVNSFCFDDEEKDKVEVIVQGRKIIFESEKFVKIKKKKRNNSEEE